MKPGINIWSGQKGLGGALTNPTTLSFRKGNVKYQYPVVFWDVKYPDAEAAYKNHKICNLEQDMTLMTKIIKAKLEQYPKLAEAITKNGGVLWLQECRHIVGVKGSRWEGEGRCSNFIVCLINAYEALL
jgi:hypothetical protein